MNSFLKKHSTRKNILILLGIVIILEILFKVCLPKGDNAIMIDMAFATQASQIFSIISNYTPNMCQSYILGALTLDVLFPIVYFLLFAFLLYAKWEKTWMIFIPLAQAISDLCENAGIITLIKSWPEQLVGLANFVVVIAWVKWGLCLITILLILLGIIRTKYNKPKSNNLSNE